jgi:hypothetical protein
MIGSVRLILAAQRARLPRQKNSSILFDYSRMPLPRA